MNQTTKNSIAPETKDLLLKAAARIDDKGTVSGVAAAFGNLDRHGDIILPTAFDKALRNIKSADDVAFLWNHDTNQPLGPLKNLRVTEEGLAFDADVVPTSWGKDVKLLLKSGTVKKMSFGYRVNRAAYVDDAVGLSAAIAHFSVSPQWAAVMTGEAQKAFDQGTGVRLLVDLDPWEVSIVPVPANPRAELSQSKGISMKDALAKGATTFKDFKFAPLETEWDAGNAEARVKEWADASEGPNAAYRSGFAWFDKTDAKQFDGYRLPIGDVIGTDLVFVPAGVFAAAAAVQSGKARIPDTDIDGVKALLDRYYASMRKQFDDAGIVAPWDDSLDDGKSAEPEANEPAIELKAGRVLSASNAKKLRALRSAMSDGMKALDEVFKLAGLDEDAKSGDNITGEADQKAAEPEFATPDDLSDLFRF